MRQELLQLVPSSQGVGGGNRVVGVGSRGLLASLHLALSCTHHGVMSLTQEDLVISSCCVVMNLSLALYGLQADDGLFDMLLWYWLWYQNGPHQRIPSRRSLHPSWLGVNAELLPDERFTPEGNARVSP